MIAIESFIPFLFASAFLAFVPGPDNIFVLTQSSLYGRKSGMLVTLGLCTGLLVHTSAVAFGVAAIFQVSHVAFTLLKIIGALYLFYLAWHAFLAAASKLDAKTKELSPWQLYRRGIIMNVTNPKVSLFFLAFLPQFASPDNGSVILQIFLLGALFIIVTLIVFGLVAVTAGTLAEHIRKPKAQKILYRTAGVIFTALALKLITTTAI